MGKVQLKWLGFKECVGSQPSTPTCYSFRYEFTASKIKVKIHQISPIAWNNLCLYDKPEWSEEGSPLVNISSNMKTK